MEEFIGPFKLSGYESLSIDSRHQRTLIFTRFLVLLFTMLAQLSFTMPLWAPVHRRHSAWQSISQG
ncbi:MAG: hypothetical protein WCD25_31060, partial [Pseudolabrys sp.]